MTLLRIPVLALAVAAVLVLAGPGRPGQAEAVATGSARTLTVTSSGSATAVPDRAAFSFGVTSQAKTAAGALVANGAEMKKVIAALKGAGVAAKDVRTESVSLSPRYSGSGEDIVGYTASNTVDAEIKGIGRVRRRDRLRGERRREPGVRAVFHRAPSRRPSIAGRCGTPSPPRE